MLACIFHVTESTLSLNLGSWKARKLQLAKRLLAALWTLSPKSLVLQWSTEPNSIWRGEFFIEFIHELSEPVVLMYQNDSDWINPKKMVSTKKIQLQRWSPPWVFLEWINLPSKVTSKLPVVPGSFICFTFTPGHKVLGLVPLVCLWIISMSARDPLSTGKTVSLDLGNSDLQ